MPRYFFHLRDHSEQVLDPEGVEMAADAIPAAALKAAQDSMSHDVREGLIDLRFRIEVEDEAGAVVHILRFPDALRIIPAGD